jgi:hypothetical protein
MAMNKPCHEKNVLKNNNSSGNAVRAVSIGTVGRGQQQPASHALSLWHKKDFPMLGEADNPPDCRNPQRRQDEQRGTGWRWAAFHQRALPRTLTYD